MKWESDITDPMPALILEAYHKGAQQDKHPCSLCHNVTQAFHNGVLVGQVGPRSHFHASDVGACKRKVLYSLRNPTQAKSSSNPTFLKMGHSFESFMLTNMHNGFISMIEKLKNLGVPNVVPASNQEELVARIPVMIDGDIQEITLVAHWDGVLAFEHNNAPGQAFLLECKSVKKAKFESIQKGEMDKEWYGQVQTYLRVLDLKIAYLLVVHRESSEMLMPIRIEIDYEYLNQRRDALTEIYTALMKGGQVNREQTRKNCSECMWCKFKEDCWSDHKVSFKIEEKLTQSLNSNEGDEFNGLFVNTGEAELETFEEEYQII